MSHKLDRVIAMLDELLMRVDRLERALIKKESVMFNKSTTNNKVNKPKLTVVKSESNVIEFNKND